ncbi:MAG: D-glycerate dehydrogenase [Sandaracinaceae bacterium]|nr:D-glycerate dehydrogenase [Sandaracinaceae bacterium]
MPKLVLSRDLPFAPSFDLAAATRGLEVVTVATGRSAQPEELREACRDAHALISMLSDRVDADFLAACPELRVVANYAVGYDNLDLAAARRAGIVLTNTPDVLTEATADIAFALLLGVARRVREGERLLRAGHFHGWRSDMLLGSELHGRVFGLIGMGRIGAATARRARGFGMRVHYCNRNPVAPELAAELSAERRSLDELLAEADVLSVHCPLTPETHHLLNAERLAQLKPSAILINTARGPVVDEAALVDALSRGALRGAGLDVYEHEPRVHPGLLERDDVMLLPHLGSATTETRAVMAELALANCLAVLAGEQPKTPIG